MAMLRGMQVGDDPVPTVHGFRSAFRDWADETTGHPCEVIEHALAHQLADSTKATYCQGDALECRRALMLDWADHCASKPQS